MGVSRIGKKGLSEELTFILRLEVGGVNFGKIRAKSIPEEQASAKFLEAPKSCPNGK